MSNTGRPVKTPSSILTIYESIGQASSATNIPRKVLSAAKASGCPGFRNSRVYLLEVLPWMVTHTGDGGGEMDWETEQKKQQALRTKTVRLKLEEKLIPIDAVEAGRSIAVQTFCAELDRIKRDMPAVLKGLDEAGIRSKLAAHISSIKPRIVAAFESIGNEHGN